MNEHTDPGHPMSPEANDFDCAESHNSEEHEKIVHELKAIADDIMMLCI